MLKVISFVAWIMSRLSHSMCVARSGWNQPPPPQNNWPRCKIDIASAQFGRDLTSKQGKSGLESVLQDDDDCDDKENRTFQKMVVRAVKK